MYHLIQVSGEVRKLKPTKEPIIKNQIVYGAPKLPKDQVWKVIGQVVGKRTRKCVLEFKDFSSIQYICRSGDYYHFIGDSNTLLVCSIIIK